MPLAYNKHYENHYHCCETGGTKQQRQLNAAGRVIYIYLIFHYLICFPCLIYSEALLDACFVYIVTHQNSPESMMDIVSRDMIL